MDAYYQRLQDDTELIADHRGGSEIQKFYAGKTILLTGSTGFMGKCLVEKILRSCRDVKRIYVLVRPKRGSSMEERMKTYLDNELFDVVRKMYPDCASKIHAIEGDLSAEDLELSEKDSKTMIDEVDFIIHNASNVKFNEKISTALKINVLGTVGMITLAKKCKHLEAFLYVSTAFSHSYQQHIEEKAYPSPADLKLVHRMIETDTASKNGMDDKELQKILGKYPNTYTLTKATAEGLIEDLGKEVSYPCIIYRPSVVVSSWKEPLRAWCGNINGPAMLFSGIALGVVRAAYVRDTVVDFVPVDLSINAILVVMWDAKKNRTPISGAFVYNYGSSTSNPLTLRHLYSVCVENPKRLPNPSIHSVWPLSLTLTTCVYHFAILHVIYHLLPAILADLYFLANGQKTQALAAYKKATMNYHQVTFFINGGFRIQTTQMNRAVDCMNSVDRDLFFCDIRKLDWSDYGLHYWRGLRTFVLKDPMSTVPAAIKRHRKLEIMKKLLNYSFIILFVYVVASYLGIL